MTRRYRVRTPRGHVWADLVGDHLVSTSAGGHDRLHEPPDGEVLGRPSELDLAAPVQPSKIIAVGLNYRDHIREAGLDAPSRPLLFAKLPSALLGPRDAVSIDPVITSRVDWEVELAVVIGRRARRVPQRTALDHVAGYTVANDLTARDLQSADGQWTRGKNLDGFCPIGPAIVTPDEVGDPQRLRLRTLVDGEEVQSSTTEHMIFDVSRIIAFCAAHFTLEPGDVLLTGTPWGCGEFMDPPRSLQPGQTLVSEIDGIGSLVNAVRRDPAAALPGDVA